MKQICNEGISDSNHKLNRELAGQVSQKLAPEQCPWYAGTRPKPHVSVLLTSIKHERLGHS